MARRRAAPGPLWTTYGCMLASLLVVLVWIVALATSRSEGLLFYAVDDTYIHLALARTLVESGTWGFQAGAFEPASSSPAWTLLLAGVIAVLPDSAMRWAPLALNAIFVAVILWLFASRVEVLRVSWKRPLSAIGAIALPQLLFLPGLAMVGMEHSLHAVLFLGVLLVLPRVFDDVREPGHHPLLWTCAMLALMGLVRYESMALGGAISGVMGWAALRRSSGSAAAHAGGRARLRAVARAAAPLAAACAPVVLLGSYYLSRGVLFFGNSASVKLGMKDTSALEAVQLLVEQDPLLAVLLAVLLAAILVGFRIDRWSRSSQATLCVVFITSCAHVLLAEVGHWHRYEAYLVIGSSFALLALAGESFSRQVLRIPLAASLALALWLASGHQFRALALTAHSCHRHYLQQYQMGRFFAAYYQNKTIAVNDLGSVAYEHTGKVVDLVGLGSKAVANAQWTLGRWLDAGELESFAQAEGVEVVAIYDSWYRGRIPDEWRKAGELLTPSMMSVVVPDRVSFYAVSSEGKAQLAYNLASFAADLPRGASIELRNYPRPSTPRSR